MAQKINYACLPKNLNIVIKTHNTESRGQEEAGRIRQTSELFTRSTALKFVNALNKPPRKLSIVIKDSARSNYIESVIQQWRKSAPPILSTSHGELYGICLCAHTRKTIPLAPIHLFTKQIVPSLYQELLT